MNRRIAVVALGATLGASVVLWFCIPLVWHAMHPVAVIVPFEAPTEEKLATFPGSLVFTASERSDAPTSVYRLDLTSHSLETLYTDVNAYMPVRNASGTIAAVLPQNSEGDRFGLSIVTDVSKPPVLVEPPPGYVAGVGTWSPDGRSLAYVAWPDTDAPKNVDTALILVYDTTTGKQIRVGTGVSPAYFPSGSLAYLTRSGVFVVQPTSLTGATSTPEGIIALDMDQANTAYSSLALSPDGNRLVIMQPELSGMFVYTREAKEWYRDTYLNERGIWPRFSPNGAQLAFIRTTEFEKAFMVYDFTKRTLLKVFDASPYDITMLSLSAWEE